MIISVREYLHLIRRGIPETIAEYSREIERLDGLILSAVPNYEAEPIQNSTKLSKPEQYVEALDRIRTKYDNLITLYEEERFKCTRNIQHLPTPDQSQVAYLYIIAGESWEKIACTRCTTFEAVRGLMVRAYTSYEALYGSDIEIDDRIYRA